MILTATATGLLRLLSTLISYLPLMSPEAFNLLNSFVGAIDSLKGYLVNFNWLFPIDDIMVVVYFIVGASFIIWTFHFVRWILSILSGGIFK